ncbi:hypothetical protein AAHB49_26310 [Bacillus cereus]
MTKLEREQPEIINASRKNALPKVAVQPYKKLIVLIKQFDDMKKMMKTMTGMQKGKKKGLGGLKFPFM